MPTQRRRKLRSQKKQTSNRNTRSKTHLSPLPQRKPTSKESMQEQHFITDKNKSSLPKSNNKKSQPKEVSLNKIKMQSNSSIRAQKEKNIHLKELKEQMAYSLTLPAIKPEFQPLLQFIRFLSQLPCSSLIRKPSSPLVHGIETFSFIYNNSNLLQIQRKLINNLYKNTFEVHEQIRVCFENARKITEKMSGYGRYEMNKNLEELKLTYLKQRRKQTQNHQQEITQVREVKRHKGDQFKKVINSSNWVIYVKEEEKIAFYSHQKQLSESTLAILRFLIEDLTQKVFPPDTTAFIDLPNPIFRRAEALLHLISEGEHPQLLSQGLTDLPKFDEYIYDKLI